MPEKIRAKCEQCGNVVKIDPPSDPRILFMKLSVVLNVILIGVMVYGYVAARAKQAEETVVVDSGDEKTIQDLILSGKAEGCNACIVSAKKLLSSEKLNIEKARVANMALVPAGEYSVGRGKGSGDDDELPRHKVFLDSYYIDKHEVTVGEYMAFVEKTQSHYPRWHAQSLENQQKNYTAYVPL
ncbi:MAG: SUMF1/EgtB/PvdO family nonheme iron enzyme, partial [Elusimicrobiaceae bacterium]